VSENPPMSWRANHFRDENGVLGLDGKDRLILGGGGLIRRVFLFHQDFCRSSVPLCSSSFEATAARALLHLGIVVEDIGRIGLGDDIASEGVPRCVESLGVELPCVFRGYVDRKGAVSPDCAQAHKLTALFCAG